MWIHDYERRSLMHGALLLAWCDINAEAEGAALVDHHDDNLYYARVSHEKRNKK
jgi:hypothetical protein